MKIESFGFHLQIYKQDPVIVVHLKMPEYSHESTLASIFKYALSLDSLQAGYIYNIFQTSVPRR